MQFIPCPGVCSIEMIYQVLDQRVENVFHASQLNAWTESELSDLGAIFAGWYSTLGKTLHGDHVSLEKIVLKDLTTKTGPAIEYTAGLPIQGTAAGTDYMPLNVTAAVSFGTALRGRSYRGRIYQTGFLKSMTAGNQITGVHRGFLIADYASLVTLVTGGGKSLVVLSRFANKAPRVAGVGTDIRSVSVDINLDSQRRRLTGRGQ